MRLTMSQRQAVTKTSATQYKRASRMEKGTILDELCATTSWHRKPIHGLGRFAFSGASSICSAGLSGEVGA
jgi:hypothetical protein